MQSTTTEDYIKRIYTLQIAKGSATTSAIANALSVSDASANDMMKRLSEHGIVKYFPRKGVQLTKKGKSIALKLVRRHRLWEMFLHKFLGYAWDEIHDEAEQLEHVTSDALEERIDKALGYPTVDPHGDPIPTVEGELPNILYTTLDKCSINFSGMIIRVSDESPEALQYFKKAGLELNTKFEIIERITFDGSIIIKANNKIIALSQKLAQCIFTQHKTT
jgi:DtxR family Mn-dependent transcriptional regulator